MITRQEQLRDMRRTGIQTMLIGWAFSMALVTFADLTTNTREDLLGSVVIFNMFAVFGCIIGGWGFRSTSFFVGYLLTTMYVALLFIVVPLPHPHP